ncbi:MULTISPECIES: hypothetical protein [unclassified Streptomyces]|uniref:hypothetical protein n=1 Tax=unclassified Streptomyces TaxID=2593676 RepID=UPI0036514394
MKTSPRLTHVALDSGEARHLERLTQKVEECTTALEQARAALSEAAGRIAAGYGRGGPAAFAARVGRPRRHVSTLAAAHRRRQGKVAQVGGHQGEGRRSTARPSHWRGGAAFGGRG